MPDLAENRPPAMHIRAILALALWAASAGAAAGAPAAAQSTQTTRTLRGAVLDSVGGAPVAGALVRPIGAKGRAVVTPPSGVFRLRLDAGDTGGPVALVVTRIGYAPETLYVSDGEVLARLRPRPLALSSVVVEGERSLSAASSEVIRELDVRLRPRESSQELLRLVPGLVIAQHAGGGKAEQIFLRGFDADHGTDVAISVDGTPVNMVSHGHGQGYADLHFLMPEVVDRIEVRKGPYDVRDGDFTTAGAVVFHTKDRLDAGRVGARAGSFGTARALALVPFGGDARHAGGYAAIAANGTEGPFEAPHGNQRISGFGKFTAPAFRGVEVYASASGSGGRWDQSGQVPARAVESRLIGRFGSLDSTEGGDTQRFDLSLGARSLAAGDRDWSLRLFAARYGFRLYSNFTFFLHDTANGDGIEQSDVRTLGGGLASYRQRTPLLGAEGNWLLGAGARVDGADVTLSARRARQRLRRRVDARIAQTNIFSYVQRELLFGRSVVQLGLRGDAFRFGVRDRLVGEATELPHISGARWHGIASPKLNVTHRLTDRVTLYGNTGIGFHSNDARDVVQSRHADRVLPRASGAEVGARYTWDGGSVAAALWGLDLQSELVYVGDEGVTEASGPTRRLGTDLEARVRLAPWLWVDTDLNLARGRYRTLPPGGNRIPLAPTATATGGLTVRDAAAVEGGVRYRFVGSRAANEDGSVVARGYTVWELFAAWRVRRVVAYGAVDNLFDVEWDEAQFATTSRLRGEPTATTENHFTPGAPRGVQFGLEYTF
jgi:hypothetical protein